MQATKDKAPNPQVTDTLLCGDSSEASAETASVYACGIGRLQIPCLQRLATPKWFLLVFCVLGVLQGAYRTYFIGIQSTLERRFAIPSKATGLILTAENISPVLAVIAGYYSSGERFNQPLWLACGMVTVVVSCGLCVLPHFLFGPGVHLARQRLGPHGPMDGPGYEFCNRVADSGDCLSNVNLEGDFTIFIMFVANLLHGFGSATFYVVGMSYMDDNVKKKDSPMYFGTMFALRLFGPSAGYLLASYCLSHFEIPFVDPGVEKTDPHWIGAWWLGYVFIGILVVVFAVPMLMFPRKLWTPPSKGEDSQIKSSPQPLASDHESEELKTVAKRLLSSPLFLCQAATLVFTVNGLMGYLFSSPKYMETQFRHSAATASLFAGSLSLASMLLGVLFSGAIVRKLKPGAGLVSAHILVVDVLLVVCFAASFFLGCDTLRVSGVQEHNGELNLMNDCNAGCGCTTNVFQPVCGPDDRTTYFSPCFAGCQGLNTSDVKEMLGCKCLLEPDGSALTSSASKGYCFDDCTMFVPFVAVLALAKFVFATSRAGTALIGLRCFHQRNKTVALAVYLTLGSIFGFIPYPLIYGALMDSSCLVWDVNCGARGNCWLYDSQRFRYLLHGLSMGFLSLGALFSCAVYLFGKSSSELEDDQGAEDDDEDVVFMRNMGHPGITHST
ncbi:solute carrier organic anion transporter family member 74D [Ixodes scapularis]